MNVQSFCDYLKKSNGLPNNPKNIKDICVFFQRLKEGIDKGEPCSLIIGEYLYINIASEKVRKRKSSATEFEDFLEHSMGGKVTDNESRQNLQVETISGIDPVVAAYISSNRREKIDIIFPSNYGVTLKTSVPNNNEINMGSFAREALFKDFLTPQEYGGERKGGLGSKPQIKATFDKIKNKGLWPKFCERFKTMVNNVYVDDMVFVIKGGEAFEIYCISGKILRETLINAVQGGPDKAIEILNRYEGNSIRVERNKIISKGSYVKLDFSSTHFVQLRKVFVHLAKIEQIVLENFGFKKLDKAEKEIYVQIKILMEDMRKLN